ncbi:MAG: LacI family DNA-binding transcriptional regulator [Planctomycetota bacterium]
MVALDLVNIRQVAKIAGVSKSTVSGVLSGRPGFAAATRERITEIAGSLGYQVHGAAAALASGRSRLLGIVPAGTTPFRLTVWDQATLEGFVQTAAENAMQTVLLTEITATGVPRLAARRQVDGAAFMIQPHPGVLEQLLKQSVPCVAINLDTSALPPTDVVRPDDASGVEQAVRHLASLGHRRIAYINSYAPRIDFHRPSLETRLAAYVGCMSALRLDASPGYDVCCAVDERVAGLLAVEEPPTALLCYSDDTARRAIGALADRGLRVPQDVSVVGIDDLETPPGYPLSDLTSVYVPFEEMGARAAKLLCERLNDPLRPVQHVVLPEHLVVRQTTAAPRTAGVETKFRAEGAHQA